MGRRPDPGKPHSGGGDASPKAARKAQPSPVFLGTAPFVLRFVSLFTGHIVTDADWSRIRSRWQAKQVRNNEPIDIWKSRYSNLYYGCSGRSANFRSAVPENSSTGYLLIATSVGLNQQRIGITDAVVVAWILNATLVVPELDHHSFRKDDRRRENSWRGGDARFQGASMSNPSGKHLVRLASGAVGSSSPRGGAALTPAAPSGRPCAHSGGRTLRATSPPPPSPPPPCSIASAACWDSRALLLDGEEDWEEVVAVGDEAVGAEDAALDAGEGAADDYGVVFGAPPTGDEVRAAVASIQQVFENPSGVNSDAPELQALALPFSGLPSSGMFVNYFAEDSCASENQIVQLANLEHSPSYTGLEEWIEPAALVLNSTALFTREHRNVLDAFHLLQVDSSVQKMVMALSTDKAVWDAVMNNKVVQEFKRSFKDAKETDLKGSSSAPPGVMQWVLENTQAKIKEFLEKILKLVNMLFQAQSKDYDLYDDVVRMSFMLSVLVFIVVTIARIK